MEALAAIVTTKGVITTTKRKALKKPVREFRKNLNRYLGMPENGYKELSKRGAFSIMRYIESDLHHLPHHKPTSRTYAKCFNIFKEMIEGTFVTKRRTLVLFVRARKLPKEIQIRKFTVGEIKTILKRLDMYVKDRNYRNYSLLDMLYTAYSPSNLASIFLLLWDDRRWEAVEGLNLPSIDENQCQMAMDLVSQYLGFDKSEDYLWNRAQFHVKHLQNYYHILPEEDIDIAPYGFTYHCPNFIKFIQHYIMYLEGCDWLTFRSFNLFSIRSNFYRQYISERWKKSDCGYDKSLNEYLTEYIIEAFITNHSESNQGQDAST